MPYSAAARDVDSPPLQASYRLLRALFESSADGLLLADADGHFVDANRQACALLGSAREDLVGRTWQDLLATLRPGDGLPYPEDLGDDERVLVERRRGGGRALIVEVHVRRMEGGSLLSTLREVTAERGAPPVEWDHRTLEERLSKIIATAPGVICTFRLRPDGTTCCPYASPAIQDLIGFAPEEIAQNAEPILAQIHPDDVPRVQESIWRSGRTMTPWRAEYRLRHPDRGEIWIEGHSMPEREPDGSILWLGFLRDITERKRAEGALEAERHRLRTLIDNLPDLVFLKDKESRFVVANQAVATFMGAATPDELIGKTDFDFYPRERAAEYYALEQELMRTGDSILDWEKRQLDTSGYVHWLSTIKLPLRGPGGEVQGLVGVEREITARVRAEEALRYQANLLQNVSDAIIATDLDFRITSWNAAAEEMYGWSAEEAIGRTTAQLFPTTYPQGSAAEVLRQFRESGVWKGEVIQPRKDGAPIDVLASVSLIRDSAGNPVGAVAVNRDITERNRAEAEVRRLNAELEGRVVERTAQLEAANQELEAFAYSVSHDLRAPLRAIEGYTRILEDDYAGALDAEGRRVCGVIRSEARRMGQLIDDLLTFSRLSRAPMEASPIDMERLVAETIEELVAPSDRDRIELRIGRLPRSVGDPSLIRQVWRNLLSNAIKFSSKRERAIIEVRGSQDESDNVYLVRDNGAGFDMRYAGKLFGVFQRLHSEREFEGTGVGLAIVQRVVHRHGGRVSAESHVEDGATFTFTLPRKGGHS